MVQMQEKPRVQAVAAAEKRYAPIVLRLPPQWELTEQCLMEIASLNDPWRFERNAEGALEIVPPPGPLSSKRGVQILIQIAAWILNGGFGDLFESSAGFRLGDSSIRAADVSWVSDERLAGVEMDHEGAWPVCPDFVVEIRSPSDRLPQQQAKMRQWMANGARLGWLIDPFSDTVWVYREHQAESEQLERPDQLDCGEVLPGITINLAHSEINETLDAIKEAN